MAIKFLNNAISTVAADISDSDLTLQVATGEGDNFPAVSSPDYFYLTLANDSGNKEIVKVTARTAASDTMTIARAQESTIARAWYIDDVVELRLTAGVVQGLTEDVVTNAADIASNAADIASNAADLDTHEALTGSNVHGLGTLSTQNANAVAITGGSAELDNESAARKIKARDHGTATVPEVVNAVYGTGTPPTASTTPIGTLFLKYTA